MTYRWINIGFLFIILAATGVYLWASRDLALNRLRDNLEPIMFPVALGAGVVILSLVEIVRTMRSVDPDEDRPFYIEGATRLAATIALMAIYFFVWQSLGQFYPVTALLVTALILLYRARLTSREVLLAVLIALGFTLTLYLVFDLAFSINFTQ